MVRNHNRSEDLSLEERIREAGGERGFAIGSAIGEGILALERAMEALFAKPAEPARRAAQSQARLAPRH